MSDLPPRVVAGVEMGSNIDGYDKKMPREPEHYENDIDKIRRKVKELEDSIMGTVLTSWQANDVAASIRRVMITLEATVKKK